MKKKETVKKSETWATIYTDASYKEGQTGFAYYVACNQGRYTGHGNVDFIHNNNEAELFAAFKAITFAISKIKKLDGILIVSDNMSVVNHLSFEFKNKPFQNKNMNSLKKHILSLLKMYNLKIRTKHIPAHRKITTKGGFVNDLVDKKSRKSIGLKPK